MTATTEVSTEAEAEHRTPTPSRRNPSQPLPEFDGDEYAEDDDTPDPMLAALQEQNRLLGQQNAALQAQLAAQGKQLEALTSTVAALAAREPAQAAKQDDDAETAGLLRDIKREIHSRMLAAARGEDPVAEKAVERSLGQVRKLLKDVGEVKQLADEASAMLGTKQPTTPEPDLAESVEKMTAAADKFASSRVGSKLMQKFGLTDATPDTPALNNDSPEEVSATYG